MRAEHLRQWLIYATWEDLSDATTWMNVVTIVQAALHEGDLTKECTWQIVVLIPKENGDFRGIGLIEVLWKAVARLLNRRLTEAIAYHNALHRFQAVRGMGTAALEAKLLQQLTNMKEAVLFWVLLNIQKAYDTLDQEMYLELLAAYGVGPRTVRLLRTYWDQLTMVEKAGRYFGHLFKGY